MQLYEILAIILIVLFFITLIGTYYYKKKHDMPMGECACCKDKMNRAMKKIRKEYHKKYKNNL